MPKISDVGVGGFIKNPRGTRLRGSNRTAVEVLKVSRNDGNSFLCIPVLEVKGTVVVLDSERHYFIQSDQFVDQVSIESVDPNSILAEDGGAILLESGAELILE